MYVILVSMLQVRTYLKTLTENNLHCVQALLAVGSQSIG